MIKEAIATGKTLEEAKEAALTKLGEYDNIDDVEIEVLAQAKPKTLGLFGGSDAKVRVYIEVEDEVKEEVKQKEEIKETVKSAVMSKDKEKTVVDYLKSILENMGVENVKINVCVEDDGTKINFDGDKLGVAIGRKGETLDAIQHLVSLVANRGHEEYVRITLNPGEYRQKREEVLIALANKSAAKAVKFNKNIVLEAMNSYERRIIHNAVQKIDGVMSWSIGENDHRRVCIGTSKDNKILRDNRGRRNNNRYHNNRSGYNKTRRTSQTVTKAPEREPKSDSNDLPLYGIVK